MDEQIEREIVRGLRDGRVDAWQRMYDAYAERIWRLVSRALPVRSPDVGDVVQDALMAAATSARSYDPDRGALWFWLTGIARRHIALYYRRRSRQTADALSESAASLADGSTVEPLEALANAETRVLVRSVLTELPEPYELILTAKYLDEASIEQIAAREATGVEATRSRLARARRAFRKAFERRVPNRGDS